MRHLLDFSRHSRFSISATAAGQGLLVGLTLVACTIDTVQQQSADKAVATADLSENMATMARPGVSADAATSVNQPLLHRKLAQTPGSAQRLADVAGPYHLHPGNSTQTEKYASFDSHAVMLVSEQPVSTFSIDVDTGAYSNVRRFLSSGNLPPADAVRIEELINYFSYSYPPAGKDEPFSISSEIATTPWNPNTHLLHLGLKGYQVNPESIPAANLVFLIDVSGSMSAPNKLGLLKSSIRLLSRQLSAQDKISIVVYAGASGVVLEPTAGDDFVAIDQALNGLQAGGSTNGESGIKLAYSLARKGYIESGVNRILLATDGDFNVGIANVDRLKKLIAKERRSGVALSTLGFGTGNYNDHLMEQLADAGNGAYAYIDTLNEARKVLSDELTATLLTIAKDVKIQLEFNPAVVSEYRLLGYENRQLANEDFNNDKVDAGEIGAGHTVTAIYEIALHGESGQRHSPRRYAQVRPEKNHNHEIAHVRLRYKKPGEDSSRVIEKVIAKADIIEHSEDTSDNYRFAAAVAAFGQWLRDDKYLQQFDTSALLDLADNARGDDPFGYRAEFLQLVRTAQSLDAPPESWRNSSQRRNNSGKQGAG